MLRLRRATVEEVLEDLPDLQRLRVALDPGGGSPADRQPERGGGDRCVVYPQLTGRARPGDSLLLNTTAVDLGLGTGGWHFAVANLTRAAREPISETEGGPGHIIKARYTPLQVAVETWEMSAGAAGDGSLDLEGLPVVICHLHSHLAPAVVGFEQRFRQRADRAPRIVYLMSDAAALPLPLSDQVRQLKASGYLLSTISCGQAFGGDREALTLASGLLAARTIEEADGAVVAQGPGNAGAGGALGCGATTVAEAVNTVAALGGGPIVAPRVSLADPRPRHQGVSHHTLTALLRLSLARATVVFPRARLGGRRLLEQALGALSEKHEVVWEEADDLLRALESCPVALRSMGRTLGDDPLFFLSAAAAGAHAGEVAALRPRSEATAEGPPER